MMDAEERALATGNTRSEGIRAARDAFYMGDPARAVDAFFGELGGLVTYDDLASYEALRSGALFEGRRRSVFREVTLPGGETLPLVVASLRARQLEEAGLPSGDVLGMPLGLPSVSPEVIQLLETWIAQGRRR